MALMKGVCSSPCLGLSPGAVVDVNKCMWLDQTRNMSMLPVACQGEEDIVVVVVWRVVAKHNQLTHSLVLPVNAVMNH